MYNEFDAPDTKIEIVLAVFDDIVYTGHFLAVLFCRKKIYQVERESRSIMLVHFLSGYENVASQNIIKLGLFHCLFHYFQIIISHPY